MLRRRTSWVLLIVACLATVVVYQQLHRTVVTEMYRQRLEVLGDSYEQLRQNYNQAVARTAVTELLVDGGRLSVVVRTIQGVTETIETPFDPYDEVFVDFVVVDGRLLVRRVFDAKTAPSQGLLLDHLLEHIDWEGSEVAYGKAVYRRLEQGRWVVTVTGDGSLGLARSGQDQSVKWAVSPAVQDYPQILHGVDHQIDRVGWWGVLARHLWPR